MTRAGLSRRAALAAVASAWLGCRRNEPSAGAAPPPSARPAPAPAPSDAAATAAHPAAPEAADATPRDPGATRVRVLEFPRTPGELGPERAVVVEPAWARSPGERYPVLVALHGRGESLKGLDGGAWGWVRDYDLVRAIERLRAPPLTREDFRGFVDEARLAKLDASLAERPFRGLVVACPWVPDVLDARRRADLDAARDFGAFVVTELLPRVRSSVGEAAGDASGIDGVSLGGRVALLVGLAHPDRLRAIGSLQAAIQASDAPELARRASRALAGHHAPRLRLLTSDGDYFKGPIGALHGALRAAGVDHEHLVVPGPHDYPFNRGPGAIEMLLWHDRVLRGEPGL